MNAHASDREVRGTLLHEMAHASSRSGHTVRFFAELERLLKANAPVIIDAGEAGRVRIFADLIPRRFPLLRRKMELVERRRSAPIRRYIKSHPDRVVNITNQMIVMEFVAAAREGLTWRCALAVIGNENGLVDEGLRPRTRRTKRIIDAGFKAFHREQRELREEKRAFERLSRLASKS